MTSTGNTETALTEESAHRALRQACRQAGLDPTGAELIRLGSHAVYRLRTPVIVRIARDQAEAQSARRQVAVARWLAGEDYPATRALQVEQPIEANGRVVTLWESASEQTEYAPVDQVARVIRQLHDLDPPTEPPLPAVQPFGHLDQRRHLANALPADEARFLLDRIDELRQRYARLDFTLPPGPIHGDANVGNVILDRTGCPILIDLDNVSTGPREWDLVQTALFYDRFGWHTTTEYRAFVEVYGFDILSWPGYPVLADYREVAMTLWLSGKAATDNQAADEVHKRIVTMQTGGDRRNWAPF